MLFKLGLLLLTLAFAVGGAAADTLSVPAPDCTPVWHSCVDGSRIRAAGFSLISSPGNPALPCKDVLIVVPPDANLASVSVNLSGDKTELLPATSDIAPAPPMAVSIDGKQIREWGKGKQIRQGRNDLVYQKPAFYPASHVELLRTGKLRKWRIAEVRYYPYCYNPVTRMLQRSASGRIVVSYRTRPAVASQRELADTVLSSRIRAAAANYDQARTWYAPATISTKSLSSQAAEGYLILTTSAIASASTKLQAFLDHKTRRGFTVFVATQSDWGGGTGDIAANNIRAYLQANYIAKNIHYVLLVGNPDPAAGDVPMKMLWPRYTSDIYREAPSDYFYADLTGNWDLNGDGYFGEEDLDFGPGGIDRFPEVIIGRIPVYAGDTTGLDSILVKIIDYESGVTRGGWIRNVLLSMNPSDSDTPGYQLGEAIKNDAVIPASMTATRVYDSSYGLSPAPDYTPCSYGNVLSAWQQRAGFHFWWTHGNDTLAADVFSTSNCQYLNDAFPTFTFQCSCLNAEPENSGNLAYSLLKNGALATDAATRVSWYYPGEDVYSGSDSNAGMTYDYALRLIRDHLPCGDAHYAMMTDVPDDIWMNHCVFNLYGDPSVAYPMAPIISHTPLANTDNTTAPYLIRADVTATSPLASGNPILRWNTTGGPSFAAAAMAPAGGSSYAASIPAQPYGTTVYYYIEAADITALDSTFPSNAPASLLSFRVIQDTQPPVITHTPLPDTADKFGPYVVQATITDDLGVSDASLYYNVNGGAYTRLQLIPQGQNVYAASIPGPANSGDTVNYYITATDSSQYSNTSRLPAGSGCFSFHIGKKIYVAVLNSSTNPSYFVGLNSNAWQDTANALNADPAHRFQVSVLTSLMAGPGSLGLAGQDALVLPDNAPAMDNIQSVSDWFSPGKVILALDSAACFASYSGWMWSGSAGSAGYGTYWANYAGANDQQILASDPITSGYTLGQTISSAQFDAQFYAALLPADAHVLSAKASDHACAYAVYRDVPGRGRFVMLGPYIRSARYGSMIADDQVSMVREALVPPPLPRQIQVTSPNGGESYESGDLVTITWTTSGAWQDVDRVKLEYCTGLDSVWRPIAGADSLPYDVGSCSWDTTRLPGSHGYLVRATWVGNALSDQSDAPFSIVPAVDIASAKSVADGGLIKLAGKLVTCAVPAFTYVEEPNRRAGMKVSWSQSLSAFSLVDVTGVMGTVNGERVINAETVDMIGTGARIGPYAIKTGALGGSAFGLQGGVHLGSGLNNIGLLVRLCGRITAVGSGWCYLDDGSMCCDTSGNTGVRIYLPAGVTVTQNQLVVINAVSSTYFDGTTLFRAAVLPDKESLQVVGPP